MAESQTIQARAEAIVAKQQAQRDSFWTGIRYGGMAPDAPVVETVEAVAARLEREDAERAAFAASPRGRFLACIQQLEQDGYHADADRLRGIYSRHLTRSNPVLDARAVGEALLILNPLDCLPAQEASDALAELLIAEAPMAKAA